MMAHLSSYVCQSMIWLKLFQKQANVFQEPKAVEVKYLASDKCNKWSILC